ncbi:MAG: xanthine dehydrogenase family protein subunit M [Chloroflexi bacterium]|nr:xanthine dehydrogenase family protein subunit M [Chloroflexota bacterium]
MIPESFEYFRAHSVQEAVSLLNQHGDNAKILAGGHSLIPLMKLRLATPKVLIDIGKIPGLAGVKRQGNELVIGALTTYYMLETSPDIKSGCQVIADASSIIGDMQVRNKGTIGGSLSHADPASDMPAVVLALGATLKAVSSGGERTINIDNFFVDLLATTLKSNEVLTEIRVPVLSKGTGAAYSKYPHPASRYAVVGVAAMVAVDGSGTCTSARIGVTGASAYAYRATKTEQGLTGKSLDQATIQAAAEHAADNVDMLSDLTASEEYRAHLVSVMARRAITEAARRARS